MPEESVPMTSGELVSLIIGIATLGGMMVGVLFFLVRLQLSHNNLKKDQERDNEALKRTSRKADNTNRVVRIMYINQVRLLDKMGVNAVSPEDSNIDLPPA